MKFNKNNQKENLNKLVEFINPYYIETDLATIGSKTLNGIIKDYDGEFFIIEFNKKEFYINGKDILKEVLK